MTDYIKSHPDLFISDDDTLRDALKKLDSSAKKNLFLVENDRLKAALSDGDIRRWLLNGGSLDATACVAANYPPKFIFDTERGRVNEKFREYRIDMVPVVDENLLVLDLIYRYAEVDLSGVRVRQLRSGDLPMISEFFEQMAGDTRAMFNRNDVNRIRANDFFSGRGAADQVQFAAVISESGTEQMVGYVFLRALKIPHPVAGNSGPGKLEGATFGADAFGTCRTSCRRDRLRRHHADQRARQHPGAFPVPPDGVRIQRRLFGRRIPVHQAFRQMNQPSNGGRISCCVTNPRERCTRTFTV